MKQPTYLKIVLAILMLFMSLQSFSQNLVPFVPRYDEAIKGDMLLIGNSNIGVHRTDPYNYTGTSSSYNNEGWRNNTNMVNVDIDSDGSTFNSSSANLDVPSDADCYQIVYAGLYWSAVVSGTTPMQNVKFRTPGSSGYVDITGTQIYYQNNAANKSTSDTYVYYRDVTDILATLGSNREGTYTVANISSMTSAQMNNDDGYNTEGLSAGWSLFVIYEDPMMPSKYITSFDGFTKINNQGSDRTQNFVINGFQTIPTGPVNAKYAFSALEGDRAWENDYLEINNTRISATTAGGTTIRPNDNFFNSSVSIIDPTTNAPMSFTTGRTPASLNTLGFDAGIINIPNPSNNVIANGATSANITLGTETDIYYFYFSAFAIEIIAPNIVLTKIVEDVGGNDIGGQVVDLGDELYYTIGFQNTGNDNATDLTIRDILPTNVVFDPADINLLDAGGATVQSYNPTTRELIFNVPNTAVEQNDPVYEIRFKVTVVSSCSLLSDACSNNIDNQAYATYKGTINPDFTISDDPSFASNTGCLVTPGATNFLADLNDCIFEENVILCGESTVLTAGDGYDSYSWSTSPSGLPVIGTDQQLTVTTPGTYYVHNTAVAPCQSIDQVFHVERYGGGITNPVIPFADEVVICPNDGKQLPNIYLCGANDFTFIETNITDTSSMIWEKLVEGSCDAVTNLNCANESDSCEWDQVATGPDFTADTAGQYRLTLNYAGGCFNQFYFNVYENLLEPTVSSRDIFCTTPGEITVNDVPNGYVYSIDGVNYQTSNVFSNINTPNTYTVYIKQDGVTSNPCIFTENVQIRERDLTISTIITQPLCHGELGSVTLAANDVRPQYFFSISQGGTEVNSVGPIQENDYTFSNLNPGTYTVEVSTEDGCVESRDIEIINPPLLTATAALTTPLTCTDGEITIYPEGGTAPYYYYINSTTEFQSTQQYIVTATGDYNITVVDANNCSTTTSITVDAIPEPEYTIADTDILCYNSNNGVIQFNVTNSNGYTIAYSIDNGVTYQSNATFSNLGPGDYPANIRYSLNGVACFSTTQAISITQPDSAVTASAGVSVLACGGIGRVRITNPQGGVPPYEYSFDNQATWVTTNEADVAPGSYTLYIRDANNCIYSMPGIILDPEPVAPTIEVTDPDFNCEGGASSTVTVTNPDNTSFIYRYLLNGVENPNTADPKTFLDVPAGNHTITVEYTLSTVPTYSNLLYETFGYGDDTTSPGINTAYYCFERQVVATQCKGNIQINDGDYSVTSRIVSPFSAWINPVDHTPPTNPVTPKGRYMVVNIGASIPTTEILYEKQINDIIPNRPINVEFYAMNLLRTGNTQFDPDLVVALVDGSGTEISSFSTGNIPKTQQWEVYPKTPMTLDPGANTSLRFIVRSNVQQTSGNDVAIDDISVYQLPAVCTTTVDFPFIVASGNAFTASVIGNSNVTCAGESDGTVTIAAQNFDPAKGFQYSIDNGLTWNTQMTSPYTITGLAPVSYDIQVRYENVVDTCVIPLTQTITAPSVLEVTASATPITCLDESTVTATATGGSPAYTYELLDASSTLLEVFPGSGILTNVVAGDYIVRVTDANGCEDTYPLNILDVTPPTATIINADYCYDTNGASFEVSASGGLPPYEYSMNGAAYTSNNIFSNLVPGTYEVTVRDANGCTFDLPDQIIAEQVVVSVTLTKELDCTASPDAVITGTISEGYAPYTVTLIQGSGTVNLSGNTFTLETGAADTYQFQVTDANGCTAVSNVVTVNPIEDPTATTTLVHATCHGSNDGSVQIVPSGGVGPYTYSFNGSPFTSTSLYPGLAAGTYAYEVRDAKNCLFIGSVTITEPTALVASATATVFSCDVSNTPQSATVTIDLPTTGTAPYQYSFNGLDYSSNNTLTVNDNGTTQTITYWVKDANGCEVSDSIDIDPLNSPTDLTFTASDITCLDTTSTVELTATGGVGTLTYEIMSPASATGNITGATTGIFTGLTPDTYVFRVTDENGCYYTESFAIVPVTPITVTGLKLSDVLCFGVDDGEIRFDVANFSGTYSYQINTDPIVTGQTNATITLSNLAAGVYTINVTDETTGCPATENITITQPASALGLTATATNVHCNNDESQITVTPTGGTPNYTYAVVIAGSPAPNDAAYGNSNVITIDTNSGIDLDWDVYVKDMNGCTETTPVTIIADDSPTIDDVTVNNQCDVSSGFTFTVTATGGVAPLRYSINGGTSYQASPTFTVNAPGSYIITVIDANGCTADTSATPTVVYAPITASALLTQDLTCFIPAQDASIDITVSGGLAPYTYEVSDDGGTTYTSISGSPYTTAIAGTYQFRITDANGCDRVTTPITINPIVYPEIDAVTRIQDITCNGENTGALDITIDATLGLAPFVINVYNNTTLTDYGTQTSGLAAGDYTITVTDAKGCTDTENVTIDEPDAIDFDLTKVDITCNNPGGSSLGSITVDNITGGTGSFTYYISNNFGDVIAGNPYVATANEAHTFTVINYGIYTINVIDTNGCSYSQQITMASPPEDLDIIINPTVIDCATGGIATIQAISAVGSGNYEFGILEFNTPPYTNNYSGPDVPGGSIKTYSNLTPGVVYTFVVHDITTDCYFVKSADIPIPPVSPLTSTVIPNNVVCQGENNGSVTFTIDNFDSSTVSITYEIFTAFSNVSLGAGVTEPVTFGTPLTVTTPSPASLSPGQYYIVFTENGGGSYSGCQSASTIFEIRESSIELDVTASVSKNENCNELGVLSAIASNGTAPYVYQVVASGASPDSDPSSWSTTNTFERPEGDYDVYVRDAYGCERFDTVTIIRDAEPTIDPVTLHCFDGTPFSITLLGTTFNGIATYSIGGTYQSSPNFTITAAGSYTVSIRDANGCTDTEIFIVEPPILLDANLDLDLTCTADAEITLTPSGGTGTYDTYEVSSDAGANWTPLTGPTFTTDTAGTYIFKVIDSQLCEAISNEITVTPNTTPTLTYSQIDVSCFGGANGSIIVMAADGIAPYEYRIDGGTWQTSNEFTGLAAGNYSIDVRDSKNCQSAATAVTIDEPTALVAIVNAPTFSCDVNNAVQSATVIIDEPTTGTAPYQYSFNGGTYTSTNTLTVIDNGTTQTITYSVRDANNCMVSGSVVIDPLDSPTDLTFAESNPITCNDLTTDVTLTATDGVGTLTYEIMSPASAIGNTSGATTGIFTGLLPDTYLFRVTDANGCYYAEEHVIDPVANITVSGQVISDVSCFGGNDGEVRFEVASFSGTYSYEINNDGNIVTAQTNSIITLDNLSAGVYIIDVTDETTGCPATYTVTVNQPTSVLGLTAVATHVYCTNYESQITVTTTGGTPNYRYAAVIAGSPVPTDAAYGNSNVIMVDTNSGANLDWDVYVKDINECTELTSVTIIEDPLPTVDAPTLAINQCAVATGFEFTVTNPTGIAPFTYSIGNGFQSSPTFTVSTPGTYTVTVRDGNGCTNAVPVSIEIYPALDVNATATTLPSCSNDDGVITVTGAGGSGDYTYEITSGPLLVASQTTAIFTGLPAGTYTVTITDTTTNCTDDVEVTLEAPTPVTFTTTPTDVSCINGNDGTITVNLPVSYVSPISNNNPVYTYSLDGGVTTQTSNVFTGLAEGTYNVTVISGRNCSLTQPAYVGEPDAIIVPLPQVNQYVCTVDTNLSNFATITVTGASGGSETFTRYEFIRDGNPIPVQSGSNNVYTETDLLGGTYTINVYDDNGCQGTTTAIILPFISIDTLDVTIDDAITCINDEDITVSVTSTGGTPNLEFTLVDFAGVLPTQTNVTGVFTDLPVGNYIITVENLDTGCSLQTVHYVNEPNTFELDIDSEIAVTCFGGSDGSVRVTFIDRSPLPTDEAGAFSYEVFNVTDLVNSVTSGTTTDAGPITIPNLASGTYTIIATLDNEPYCTVEKNFTIDAPTAALAITETRTEITCVSGNNDGTISASATGGWPGGYEYQLEDSTGVIVLFGTVSNFTGLTADTYTVTVKDSRDCEVSVTVELEIPDPITTTATADIPVLACFGDSNATITVDVPSGGQGSNYTYTLNMTSPTATSSGPQLSRVFSGLGAGTYTVTVRDGFNCEFTSADIVITAPAPVQASLVKETSQTCLTESELTLSATGGTGSYEYSNTASFAIILGSFTSSVPITFSVPVGTYQYYVRDSNDCRANVSNEITIDPLPILDINFEETNPTINCYGDNTGVIVAVAQGGLGNYSYTLLNGSGNPIPTVPQNSDGVFTGLLAGDYQVQVNSGLDCEAVKPITISEPTTALVAAFDPTDATCFGSGDGMLVITASGGTGIIKYAISPQMNQFFETPVFEDLYPGDYQAIAQDEQGCFVLFDFTIDEPDPVQIAVIPGSIQPELCEGDLNGAFSVEISGGTLPYSYTLDDRDGNYITGAPTQTVFDFSGLRGGNHTVYVIDGAGCESEAEITFPDSVSFEPLARVDYGCDNNLPSNTVTVTVTGNANPADLTYSLDGGTYQTSNIFVNVPSGVGHYVDVMHANGCTQRTELFDIVHYDPVALVLEDGTLNQIVAVTAGGSGVYQYTLNGEDYGSTNTFLIYRSGDYTVTVTDSYGCTASATQYFEYIDVCIPNYFTPATEQWGPGCTSQYVNLTVDIFDRYGREIATLRVGDTWDGNYNGKELPSGDYWYIVKLNDPKDDRDFVGHFTLYR